NLSTGQEDQSSPFDEHATLLLRLTRLLAVGLLLVLVDPLMVLLQTRLPLWKLAATLAGVAVFGVLYGYSMLRGTRRSWRKRSAQPGYTHAVLLVLLLLACLMPVIAGERWLVLLVFTSVCAGKLLPMRRAWQVIRLLAFLTAIIGWLEGVALAN